jgi:Mg2+ and Co2+ transporter CorA
MSTFRKPLRNLTDAEIEHLEQIKDAAERLEELIIKIPARRGEIGAQTFHLRQALTNIEQAVMWAVKAAT